MTRSLLTIVMLSSTTVLAEESLKFTVKAWQRD